MINVVAFYTRPVYRLFCISLVISYQKKKKNVVAFWCSDLVGTDDYSMTDAGLFSFSGASVVNA